MLAPFARPAPLRRLNASVPVLALAPLRAGVSPTLHAAALSLRLTMKRRRPGVWWIAKGPTRQVSDTDAGLPDAAFLAAFGPCWIGAEPPDDTMDRDCLIAVAPSGRISGTVTLLAGSASGAGNGRVRPAGPLWADADALAGAAHGLILSSGARPVALPDPLANLPVAQGVHHLLPMGVPWAGRRLLAFAGGAEAHAMFAALRAEGADLVRGIAVPGDGPVPPALIRRLTREASQARAQLVAPERDMVRLSAEARRAVLALPVRLDVADWSALDSILSAL
ncbi:tetraacyldisaccharide 4'-kinase [Anianabacter salinae]|uniref:tetraacyldisaccharide 4'-kinase n=1 Tax=Anianabacter salinae TaxID=2851023 RepID=UPI00225DDAFD|nr:tetraacyldisaccharide 4'-kinase [Anianabacter salinae]MBV0913647.1 tetraacyldisaccharide 4'-kinase [Anianabacter salinae]